MSEIAAIAALGPGEAAEISRTVQAQAAIEPAHSFAQLFLDGVNRVDRQLKAADAIAAQFAVDDAIPLHEVTIALERARLSVELMTLIRSRLVESYQEMMRMQL